jgi:lipooligosaccharide transport system ATP-binding protein
MTVIQASSLVKRYGSTNVVNGIHFQVAAGECFGLLGPNGAGKTTTMKMMYGSSRPSAGELRVLGHNVVSDTSKIKGRIGVVPQEDGLDPDFSAKENLIVYSRYHGIPASRARILADKLLQEVGLFDKAGGQIPMLSGGMKRRLCIARALLNSPEILFLDEPTTGLDPQARQWIWSKIRELKKKGLSVVLTTHYMDEAERLCDRIAIMDHGQILSIDTPANLIAKHVGHEVVEFEASKEEQDQLRSKFEKYDVQFLADRVLLFVKEGQDGKAILNLISSDRMTVRRATLEDVFLKITGHQLRD